MTIQVILAFCVWPIVTFMLFFNLGAARGFVASVVGGFLLLPAVAWQPVPGLPLITRDGVVSLSAVAATLALVPGIISRYRFHWLDLVVLTGLFGWGFTNIANGIGISQALHDWWWFAMFAAIPYFLARCLLDRPAGLATLAIGIVAGCLLMLPFVLFELRMSPTTHARVYGMGVGHGFEMARYGGWRPRVFQPSGLGMAIWLCSGAVVACGLWCSDVVRRVWRVPMTATFGVALLLGFLSRGGGAISLMTVGLACIATFHLLRWPRASLVLPIGIAIYLLTALTEWALPIRPWLLNIGEVVWGERAAGSLQVRISNEEFMVASAMQKPLFGWGGWGGYRTNAAVAAEMGVNLARVLTDGFWAITLGQRGLWGMLSIYAMFLVPGILAVSRVIRKGAPRKLVLLTISIALFSWMYAADLLLNAFATPVLGLAAGALVSVSVAVRAPTGSPPPPSRPRPQRDPSAARAVPHNPVPVGAGAESA